MMNFALQMMNRPVPGEVGAAERPGEGQRSDKDGPRW